MERLAMVGHPNVLKTGKSLTPPLGTTTLPIKFIPIASCLRYAPATSIWTSTLPRVACE